MTGIDVLINKPALYKGLHGRRVALLGHPASVTSAGQHSLDALASLDGIKLSAAFGPQHGMRGDKQDNMVESETYNDPQHGIPVFSLYGKVRRPTDEMMDSFDVILVDLQDIGTRIYTYVTTLVYMLEACAEKGRSIIVLDRPNPAGRPLEGTILQEGLESFVGAAPLLMRHGLTLGEIARWYVAHKNLDVELQVIAMEGYKPQEGPGYGWPLHKLSWVNPSPNASSLNMARCYPGTVLLEGTTLSEGRGTTVALELAGAPDIDFRKVFKNMQALAPQWLKGALIRPCYFEPTFNKHAGKLCAALQWHTDNRHYDHSAFRPYRSIALMLKCIRLEYPDYPIWSEFEYEYEKERLAIDLLSGSTFLREWVDDPVSTTSDFDARLHPDEKRWQQESRPFWLY